MLERSKKAAFLKIYEKYYDSYDLASLSEYPEFQTIIKMLTVYEKDIFEELQMTIKAKDYDKFFQTLGKFKNIELKTFIFYQNISFSIL